MQADVIAVHNTIGDVKPLWIVRDGKKFKIDKVNSVIKSRTMTLFNVTIDGQIVVLGFDGITWLID